MGNGAEVQQFTKTDSNHRDSRSSVQNPTHNRRQRSSGYKKHNSTLRSHRLQPMSAEVANKIKAKGSELDKKAQEKRKRSILPAPGEMLAGDFSQLDLIFRGVDSRGSSSDSS